MRLHLAVVEVRRSRLALGILKCFAQHPAGRELYGDDVDGAKCGGVLASDCGRLACAPVVRLGEGKPVGGQSGGVAGTESGVPALKDDRTQLESRQAHHPHRPAVLEASRCLTEYGDDFVGDEMRCSWSSKATDGPIRWEPGERRMAYGEDPSSRFRFAVAARCILARPASFRRGVLVAFCELSGWLPNRVSMTLLVVLRAGSGQW